MGRFFKILNNHWPKFKNVLEKWVILLKIWHKIGPIGTWLGHFFLKNLYLFESTFKFYGSTSLPKPNLSTPLPGASVLSMLLGFHKKKGGKVWKMSILFTQKGEFDFFFIQFKNKINGSQLAKMKKSIPDMALP